MLNKLTSYYTHTSHAPVKSLARACQTGHATNIIQGFAVGYESAVMATLVLAISIALSVFCYYGSSPVFIAYGVAMAGIGMLTLTGNTISMDVFGPVADNANGIGEMGYDEKEMGAENYKRARQILADLDAVGNTTKAETKGIAIGSAVIAAVSMFASFIATLAMGSRGPDRAHVDESVQRVRREADGGRADGVDRPAVGRGRALAVQLDVDPRGRPGGVLHHQGMPHPVPRQGDLGGDEEAQLRPRRGHLHQRRPGRVDRPRAAGRRQSDPRRRPPRALRPGRIPRGDDRLRRDARRSSWPTPAAPGTTPRR